MVANNCPFTDTRNIKSSKDLQESDVVLNDLNLLGWVILKSNSKFNKVVNEPLAKLCALDENGYWESLINTDDQRKLLFSSKIQKYSFSKQL